MDISCDVIRDLLPLYAEDLTSKASNELIDSHLMGCDACSKQLGILKKTQVIPVDVEVNSLKRVGDTIRRRRLLAVMTVLLFVVTMIVSAQTLMDARIYLSAEQAVTTVERKDDGSIFIGLRNGITGTGHSRHDDTKNIGMIAWTRLGNLLFGKQDRPGYDELNADLKARFTEEQYKYMGGTTIEAADTYNIWYCNSWTGRAERNLWEGGNLIPTDSVIDVNYHLANYCVILLLLALLLLIPGRKFGNAWYGELCIRLSILLGSLCLSAVIVSAGQLMEHYGEFTEYVFSSTIVAVPMTLTALFARQLYKLNKQDKGQ